MLKPWIFSGVLLAALSNATSAAANPCESALRSQSSASGIPSSLSNALATSLAIGPKGKMYPYAVHVNGKTSIENSATSAHRLINKNLAHGAQEVRVGCLGVSITHGHDASYIQQALDPAWNVRSSLHGINSTVKNSDIGAPLAAIINSSPAQQDPQTFPPAPQPHSPSSDINEPTETPVISEQVDDFDVPKDRSVGNDRTSPVKGSVRKTWGLFTDKNPSPL